MDDDVKGAGFDVNAAVRRAMEQLANQVAIPDLVVYQGVTYVLRDGKYVEAEPE